MSVRRRWLVAYDIADEVRLRKVHGIVLGHGDMVQYSLYICDLNRSELIELKFRLRETIHHTRDRVLFIDLGEPDSAIAVTDYLGQRPNWPETGRSIVV